MKSGFVMLAGRSNVGKSTLLNALVGSKVAIVTPKPQTTRQPVRGILHDPRGQIVFVDTPGVFLGRKDHVSKRLNSFVKETLEGVDAIVYVMDPTREHGPEEEFIQTLLRGVKIPVIAVVNKSDLAIGKTSGGLDIGQKKTLEISALKHKNLNKLVDALYDLMPDGPPHYPELQLTDMGHNQWLEELIREKIFLALEQELPYTVKVSVEQVDIRDDSSRFIQATIWTTDERYKRMIIGAKAAMLKKIGSAARKEIELATDAKAFLEITVKVDPKWPERFG